jgi:SAM-dependent methyltransferase
VKSLINFALGVARNFSPRQEFTEISGSRIPSPDRRWCGPEFKDDDFYLRSAEGEANRLVEHFQCNSKSRVLDVGCGQGRLPIGILRVIGDLNYTGVDVDKKSIEWCRRYIERDHSSFKFEHLNVYNERYNKHGMQLNVRFLFAMDPRSVDIIYLFSVFSHTTAEDMCVYLKEFLRILDDRGQLFFTTFVEEDVPNISINPENYRMKCNGPLHIVRYRKDYLFSLLDGAGYSIVRFAHAAEANGQSAIYLRKKIS